MTLALKGEQRERGVELIDLRSLPEQPLVSVFIANYNYGRFLPDAIDSLLAQTYPNWEVLICDDGSTDESRDVLAGLQNLDPRIVVLLKENGGQASAWNYTFPQSHGEIICFLDADDRYQPNKIERLVRTFREYSDVGFVYHSFQVCTPDFRASGPPYPREFEEGWLASAGVRRAGFGPSSVGGTSAIRRAIGDELFPLPEEVGGFGDAVISAQAQFLTKVKAIPESLYLYRIHDSNDSGSIKPEYRRMTRQFEGKLVAFSHIQNFVADRWSESVANQLNVEQIPDYWEELCALYILGGMPREGVRGHTPQILLNRLDPGPRQKIWTLLFVLPPQLSKWLFEQWWGKSWLKRFSRPITKLLGFE